MLGAVRDHEEDHWPLPPGSFGAYVVTDVVTHEPGVLHARAVAADAADAQIIQGLHDTNYGSRDFAVSDPEGNRWSFGPTAASHVGSS